MKLKNTILYLAALSLFSCEMKDEIFNKNEISGDVGYLNLAVSAQNKVTKAATDDGIKEDNPSVDAANFNVEIYNSEGVFKAFESYDELPETIALPEGSYTVKAHTPGEIQPKMSEPYYNGETKLSITKDTETAAKVICTMQNTKIKLIYGPTFATTFSSWTITVSDGSENILTFTQDDLNPDAIYWLIADEVSGITVHIDATLPNNGGKVSEDRIITKPDDAESNFWAGSDALTITMEPGEPSDPENPTGVTIDVKVEVSFTDSEVTEEIPVEDGNGEEGGEPTDPGEGDGEDEDTTDPGEGNGPTITFPKNNYILPDDSNAPADAVISASAGLKSVVVKIIPGNTSFEDALKLLPNAGTTEDKKKLDLIAGVELVDNTLLPDIIKMAIQGANIPKLVSDPITTSYTFPVGSFFDALAGLGTTGVDGKPSSHSFAITVEDMNGETTSSVLSVSVK